MTDLTSPWNGTLDELEQLLAARAALQRENAADFWVPYEKQRAFIKLGEDCLERLLLAGNQIGKSDAGGYEAAVHSTGLYPKWWEGHRFDKPTKGWVASETAEVARNVAQAKLCGDPPGLESSLGTGFINKHCIVGKPSHAMGGATGSYDTVTVRHHNHHGVVDGESMVQFKAYSQGRSKFQGSTLNWIWWDEEPPADVYSEGGARLAATDGISWMTFTPLNGFSEVVNQFLHGPKANGVLYYRADECPHMTPERIARNKEKWPENEWEARLNGNPFMGSGQVFRTPEAQIKFPADMTIPAHWCLLWGIDFGTDHPFAAVLCAWDRDNDVIYVLLTYKAADTLPIVHAQVMRQIAANVRVAWPHDGARREHGTGESLAAAYRNLGLKMLPVHATFSDGSMSTEAAILDMQNRFATGRLRVNESLADFFQEYRGYHRRDGQLVKVRDDLLSALMKVIMMKRFAKEGGMEGDKKPYIPGARNRLRPTHRPDINPWTGKPVQQF